MTNPFIFVSPSTRGLSRALVRHYLQKTTLPVYATHRSGTPRDVKDDILSSLQGVDPNRLTLLRLNLQDESSIKSASEQLGDAISKQGSYMSLGWSTGGVLHPERQPADLDLLLIKHFAQFLPRHDSKGELAKWVHVSARVGSIQDNKRGGWYSYRSSKAALNQVVKTFDLQLQMGLGGKGSRKAIAVGVHPGTMKTELSRGFWDSVGKGSNQGHIFEPEEAAEKLVGVVDQLRENQRGLVWDWEGKEVLP